MERDLLAVALVALVALAGLALGGGSQGAVVSAEQFGSEDNELGWNLGAQAAEIAMQSETQQNRICSLACTDLCPTEAGWDPSRYSITPASDCVEWCEMRCERILQAGYEYNYGRN